MIKKKVIFIALAFLLSVNVFSQYDKNKISISLGPSFSVGDFSSKNLFNTSAGDANTGINFYLYYCYNVTRNYSFGLKIFDNFNKYNTNARINDLNYSTGNVWTTKSVYWSTHGYLLGVAAHIPETKKFIIDIRFFSGYLFLNLPEYSFTNSSISNTWFRFDKISSRAIGYNIGTGFSYYFIPHWDILFNVDYIGANFIFADKITTYSTGSINHYRNSKQTFDIINATVGIGYNFSKIFH